MAVILGVPTNIWRAKLPQMFMPGSGVSFAQPSYFKVGMGGWINPGSGEVPRAPDPTLTDLDVIVNPGRYPGLPPNPYSANILLLSGSFVYEAPTTLRSNCVLDFGDYNDDGTGANPKIWEIGLYDSAGTMIAYGTFPQEVKINTNQVENIVRVTF
jgi:hypothetical protein